MNAFVQADGLAYMDDVENLILPTVGNDPSYFSVANSMRATALARD